ncbi:MAG: hypothetical protein KA457_07505 [Chitinophagales bacterium]|nr:hypothetical protein [Chitinophagales bacterium]
MRNLFAFICILLSTIAFACGKKNKLSKQKNKTEIWMQYDETKCQNPWHLNWLVKPTESQLLGAVKSHLVKQEINILEIRSKNEDGLISCEACQCLNGRHFYVRVLKSEKSKLETLKFYEIKEVPATGSFMEVQ